MTSAENVLDLQLKLYSQVDAEETALHAATALSVPSCLKDYFSQGSMQVLSDRLVLALKEMAVSC